MSVENMFYVPLFHINCTNWEIKKQKLKQLCKNLKFNGEQYTDFDLNTVSSYGGDIDFIFEEEIKNFKKTFNFEHHRITSCWFEKLLKSNRHSIHNHGPIGYSAVCYVEYDKNEHKPLTFISPFNNFVDHSVLFYTPNFVEEGTIIFFPSTLNHFVDSNISEKERLVVSFNLQLPPKWLTLL